MHVPRTQTGTLLKRRTNIRLAVSNSFGNVQAVATQEAEAKPAAAKATSEFMLQTLTLWLLKVIICVFLVLVQRVYVSQMVQSVQSRTQMNFTNPTQLVPFNASHSLHSTECMSGHHLRHVQRQAVAP